MGNAIRTNGTADNGTDRKPSGNRRRTKREIAGTNRTSGTFRDADGGITEEALSTLVDGDNEPDLEALGFEVPKETVRASKTRTVSKGKVDTSDVSFALVLLFALIAKFRGDHWRKTETDCNMLAGPIANYIDSLPVKQSKTVIALLNNIALAVAVVDFFAVPIAVEIELYKIKHNELSETTKRSDKTATYNGQATNGKRTSDSTGDRRNGQQNGPSATQEPYPSDPTLPLARFH